MTRSLIRVIIADDMLPIREYLNMVVGHEPDMEIIATVGTGSEAQQTAVEFLPDVVLMDLEMEAPDAGVTAIYNIAQRAPSVRCVVLTHFEDDETVFSAFEAGAVDYLVKN